MFVDWLKNVSAIFVDVYEIYATEPSKKECAPFCWSEEEGSFYIQPEWR